MLNDLLRVDNNRHIDHVEALEAKVLTAVTLDDGRRVGLQGTIDRVDRTTLGAIVITDYKTGRYSDSYVRYRGAERLFAPQPTDRSYILQVLLYCYLWQQTRAQQEERADIIPSLWFVSERQKVDLSLYRAKDEGASRTTYALLTPYSAVATPFEERLRETLETLFDFQRPFIATTELGHCDTCPYRLLCGRA